MRDTKIFFYDLETTGVKFWKSGIHQIAGIVEINGEVKEELNIKVRPHPKCLIEPEALAVGGVTLEQIQAYMPMEEGYRSLKSVLVKYVDPYNKKDKFHLSGYNNASFDNDFLRAFFDHNKDPYFGSLFWSDSLDVMVLASKALLEERDKLIDFKLNTVAKYLGIPVEDAKLHDGLYDVQLTRAIYQTLNLL